MNCQLFAVCLLLAVVGTQAKSTFKRHKVARQLLPEPVQCEAGKAKCPNSNTCIREAWFCDGDNDCGDDSDEPATCPPRPCPEGLFKCLTRNRCLPSSAVCDGTAQCTDGSDEPQDCSTRTCPDGYLKCNSGQCIDKTDYCSSGRGCEDQTPLQTLTVCPDLGCPEDSTKCPHLSKCIRNTWFCDGDNDCRDGSDELNCADRVCAAGLFRCNNGQCINAQAYCSREDTYGCRDNTGTAAICAGVPCPLGHSKCPSDGLCVNDNQLCDGTAQCSDESDEASQHCSLPIDCPTGSVRCPTVRRCINPNYFCDTDNDCGDGSDESPAVCGARTCDAGKLRCNNGQCIDQEMFCGGYSQCRDGSLQRTPEQCASITCSTGQAQCPGVSRCINTRYFCDSDNDCGDNSDEETSFCNSRTCEANEVRCRSGQCIDRELFCSGSSSCRDGSLNRDTETCPQNARPVPSGGDDGRMACMTAMMNMNRVCGSDPFGGIITQEMTPEQIRHKVIETDLSELCSPIQQWFNCMEQAMSVCAAVINEIPEIRTTVEAVQKQLSITRVMLNYVCEEEVAVINSNKACLLQPAGVTNPGPGQPPNILLVHTSMATCMQHVQMDNPNPFCISRELQACVKHVVANQCGDDIAVALDGLADRVRQAAECPAVIHHGPPSHGPPQKKRRGIYIHDAFKSFF